jgi:hypothetical protein
MNSTTDRAQIETASAEVLEQLMSATRNGRNLSATDRLTLFRKLCEWGQIHTLEPLLPLLLTLKGKPYTLDDHFPFSPLFRTRMAKNLLVKSGRQVSKSTSLAANGVIVANAIAHFSTLYVTPLYEQVRRLSGNYVRPFIDQSPVKSLWTGTNTENSVLQRSFKNQSRMYFSFALLDADRVRGLSCDRVNYDEVQDMDPDHIPIIREVMSHSKWGISWYTGTPKTEDNTIEKLWQRSSQAQWFIIAGLVGITGTSPARSSCRGDDRPACETTSPNKTRRRMRQVSSGRSTHEGVVGFTGSLIGGGTSPGTTSRRSSCPFTTPSGRSGPSC